MDSLTLFRFRFTAPLHIANVRSDFDRSEKTVRSDSLYAAIIQAWSVLGIEHPILSNQDENAIPPLGFTLSSLFPYFQADETSTPLLFFPKPKGTLQAQSYEGHKDLKKVGYIEQTSFVQLLQQGDLPSAPNNYQGIYYLGEKAACFLDQEGKSEEKFIDTQVVPRVYVPRYGETDGEGKAKTDTDIFYMERVYFKKHSGLFCLAQFDDTDIQNKVLAALHYLQDEGLGSDRHVGNGSFELHYSPFRGFEQLSSNGSEYAVNLSLFCPEDSTTLETMLGDNDDKCAYEMTKRGGWITDDGYLSYRKNSVYMFNEGSIFKTTNNIQGKVLNLRPKIHGLRLQNLIYRVGQSLFVPICFSSQPTSTPNSTS